MRHLIFLYCVFLCTSAFSQKTETVGIRKFTQKDGISSYNIRTITEDNFGFLWIATQDGLSRFDGKTFLPYSSAAEDKHRLCGIDIRGVAADSLSNLLWVLPGETGINLINTLTGNVVKTVRIPYTGNENWNICMVKAEKKLWIGTSTGLKLYNTDKEIFEPLQSVTGCKADTKCLEIRSILKDHLGNIWACYTGLGIIVYSGKTGNIIKSIPLSALNDYLGSGSIKFYNCCEILNGEVLFATSQGLRKIIYDNGYDVKIDNKPCKFVSRLNTSEINYVTRIGADIFIAEYGKLVRCDTMLTCYTILEEPARPSESDWFGAVQSMFADNYGNIWLGCQEGLGFIKNKIAPFEPYSFDKNSGIKLDHVRTIYPQENGNILVGLRDGIININKQEKTYQKFGTGHLCYHIFEDKKSNIIVSRDDGTYIFKNDRLERISNIFSEFLPFRAVSFNSHIFIGDSLIILGTESNDGILLWYTKQKRLLQIKKESLPVALSSNIVNNIFRDLGNRIWVLSDDVITILSPDFRHAKEIVPKNTHTGQPYKLFFDVVETNHSFWVASYGSGILKLDSLFKLRQVLDVAKGLCDNGVYQLYNLAEKRVLVTSNNGISVIDQKTSITTNYHSVDGLHSNGFEEVCGLMKDGKIYAGGLNGFVIIDTSKLTVDSTRPALYFTGIRTELKGGFFDTANLNIRSLIIPNNWLQTNIEFVGLDYAKMGSVTYSYRIREHDSAWIDLKQQNFVTLIGLSPGFYNLEVRASNENGDWSKPINLAMDVRPKWNETIFFKLTICLFILGLTYLAYRYRIKQVEKQQLIRHGIASDLHDDIGSVLNTVKLYIHLVKNQPTRKDYFLEIEESLFQASIGLRDMIWVLDNSDDTVEELINRIKKFAVPATEASGIKFNCNLDIAEKSIKISKKEKRNLYLIIKESINNSIKYSKCDVINLRLLRHMNKIEICISDNGIGFDMSQQSSGNGLRNIMERSKQIQYFCTISSTVDKGTKIKIKQK